MDALTQMQAQRALPPSGAPAAPLASVPVDSISRLLDLLQLAAARGAYRLEEYERIGQVYNTVATWLPGTLISATVQQTQQQ